MKSECTKDLLGLKKIIMPLKENEYTYPSSYLYNATIGQHIRHVLEFYICLIEGIENGKVNYDLRKREYLIESKIDHAVSTIDNICNAIKTLDGALNITLEGNYSKESAKNCICQTTVTRELIYCFEHSIHHQALIKVCMLEQKIAIPSEMGLAPSTYRHNKSLKQTQST